MDIHLRISDDITSFEQAVEVRQIDEIGTEINHFHVPLKTILESLMDAMEVSTGYSTPILPNNCIKYQESNHTRKVLMELPKRKWKINNAEDNSLRMVSFPRLLLQYIIEDVKVTEFRMFAIRDKVPLEENTELYYFPFANVHHETGTVCMGLNVFPNIQSLRDLEQYHLLFFAAPFGTDYGIRVAEKVGSQTELFKRLEHQSFPEDWLLPLDKKLGNI